MATRELINKENQALYDHFIELVKQTEEYLPESIRRNFALDLEETLIMILDSAIEYGYRLGFRDGVNIR